MDQKYKQHSPDGPQPSYMPTVPPPVVYGYQPNDIGKPPDLEMGDYGNDGKISADLPTSIRHGFIQKVYGILTVQLAVTFGIALLFGLWPAAGQGLIKNSWAFYTCTVLIFVFLFTLICVPGMAQKVPINFILFFLISSCFGVTMGFLAAKVAVESFLMALGVTFGVVIALTIFACQTKYDITGWAPYTLVVVILLVVFGLCAGIFQNRILNFVYGGIGAAVFSIFIVIDTQMIVGGRHKKYEYSLDDYVFAALSLYMDTINLFSYILMLINN